MVIMQDKELNRHTARILEAEKVGERVCRAVRHSPSLLCRSPGFVPAFFLIRSGNF